MKTTQLYREHNALRHLDDTPLISLGVIFSEKITEDQLICVVLWSIFRETCTTPALSVGVIFREYWLRLILRIFISLAEFFNQFVDKHAVRVRRKKRLIKFLGQS